MACQSRKINYQLYLLQLRLRVRYFSIFLALTYFVLPSTTSTIFGMFGCENLDPGKTRTCYNFEPQNCHILTLELSTQIMWTLRIPIHFLYRITRFLALPIGINFLLIYIWNLHILNFFLVIYIWNLHF